MPFPVLGYFAIAAFLKIGGSIIQGTMQNREISKARKEAKELYERNRKDTLAENERNNQLAKESMSVAEGQTQFNRSMADRDIQAKQLDANAAQKQTARSYLGDTSRSVLGMDGESLNLRGRLASRGY